MELKKQFVLATNYNEFWNMFLDKYGLNSAFMNLGKPVQAPQLEGLIQTISERILGAKTTPRNVSLLRIGNAELVHGSCLVNNYMSSLLYFEDLSMGLFVLTRPSGKTDYARFTLDGGHRA